MEILVTIGSGVFGGAGVEFPTFPLTYAVALKTFWHYRARVCSGTTVPECDECCGPMRGQSSKTALSCTSVVMIHSLLLSAFYRANPICVHWQSVDHLFRSEIMWDEVYHNPAVITTSLTEQSVRWVERQQSMVERIQNSYKPGTGADRTSPSSGSCSSCSINAVYASVFVTSSTCGRNSWRTGRRSFTSATINSVSASDTAVVSAQSIKHKTCKTYQQSI